jgi:hypothetical protein
MRKVDLSVTSDGDLRAILDDAIRDLSGDELRVAVRVLWSLSEGRNQYGALDVMDGRDWREELQQELVDALVYHEIDAEKESRR